MRLRAIGPLLFVFLLVNLGIAQDRPQMRHRENEQPTNAPPPGKKTKSRARAIGVVEFLPKGDVRLVPVALWIDGHYYDASLYEANPEPLALQPETVYQAEDYGEPTGLFTVTEPKQLNGNWVADGQWKPQLSLDTKVAADTAKEAARHPKKPGGAVMTGDADAGPPVLRRPGSNGSSNSSQSGSGPSSGSNSAPSSSTGSSTSSSGNGQSGSSSSSGTARSSGSTASSGGRPTLARPGEDTGDTGPTPQQTTSKGSSTTDDDDADRPVLKAPPSDSTPSTRGNTTQQASAPAPSNPTSSPDEFDPNRPVLQRGRPTKPAGDSDEPSSTTAVSKTAVNQGKVTAGNATGPARSSQNARSYPAVSDAGAYDMRPLLYNLVGSERDRAAQQLQKMALDEIHQFVSKRNAPALPKTATIADYDLRAFDLDFSNSPTLVFTAKLAVPGKKTLQGAEFDYHVTYVARQDVNGEYQKIFASVTDSDHLDAFPRMELVGAVDADANGRGDLLFRQYSDGGINYGLYRVFPYQLQKVFEGGSSM